MGEFLRYVRFYPDTAIRGGRPSVSVGYWVDWIVIADAV